MTWSLEWRDRLKLDEEDLHILKTHRLKCSRASRRVYIVRRKSREPAQFLARFLLNAPKGMVVDHINGDPFDNRRSNLRLCTRAENSRNRFSHQRGHRFKGVNHHPCGKWQAHCTKDRKIHYIGLFATAEEAARAYDEKARELHGEFAALNFPREGERGCVRLTHIPPSTQGNGPELAA